MTTSEIPVKVHDYEPLNTHIANGKGIKPSENKSASLSLELVKGIWRKYPAVPETRKGPATVVAQSISQGFNALELNLGVNVASGGSPSTPLSPMRFSDNQNTGHPDGEPDAQDAVSRQTGTPTSERAVDDLLPITYDSIDTPSARKDGSLPPSFRQGQTAEHATEDRSGIRHSPSSTAVKPPPPPHPQEMHSIQEVRSTLLDSIWKTAQLRFPNKVIEYEQLRERVDQNLSDSELRDFMMMGQEVIDQLRSSGKLEEVKRKYTGEGDEDVQRRIKRRLESTSPQPGGQPHTPTQTDPQRPHSATNSHSNTPAHSNNFNNVPQSKVPMSNRHISPPRAPRAMLLNQRGGLTVSLPRSPATSQPHPAARHKDIHPDPLYFNQTSEENSISETSQRATLPPSMPQPHPMAEREDVDSRPLSPGEIREDEFVPIPKISHKASPLQMTAGTSFATSADDPNVTLTEIPPSQANPRVDNVDGQADSGTLPEEITSSNFGAAKILLAKVGLPSVGLLNATFDLDKHLIAAIRRWAERSMYFDPSVLSMKIHLTSIPTSFAEKMYQERPPDALPSFLAESVSRTSATWPRPGTLYVSLNEGRPEAISWADQFFGPSSPALDLSSAVVEGTNDIQFVQLGDHSQTLFVVLAIPPSQVEQQEALALHSRRKTWVQLSHTYKNKTHVKLQFNATNQAETV